MTKLAIMSDLHIDLNKFGDFETETLIQILKAQHIDHLHIAGDISNHHQTISLPFLDKIADHVELTYNLGNHDMLDLSEETIASLDFQIHQVGRQTLLAFHGWYDYSFYPQRTEDENVHFKNAFWFDRRLNRPLSDKRLTEHICQRLESTLSQLAVRPIIAMHFVPHSHFTMTHERFQSFNAFLGSQVYHDIFKKYGIRDVVFGHAHRSYGTITIGGIRYHSRPLGYTREWDLTIDYVNQHPELNPTGTWNLSKRYNLVKNLADFQMYKTERLAQEFLTSMTQFDL